MEELRDMAFDINKVISDAEQGIGRYLDSEMEKGHIDQQLYDDASGNTLCNLREWLEDGNIDRISPNLKAGIVDAVEKGRWEDIVNAFRKHMSFGTGGIRGLMACDKASIETLARDGLDARILKGPNTLNNVVLLKTSVGVAKFGVGKGFSKIVIGYDSRVRGHDFAETIAELFIAFGYTVYLFDEPCPYPEVTFAIPHLRTDMGILISASHNDYRYNGYKLSCGNGSQFDPEEREEMYREYIVKATTDDIKLCPISDAPKGKVYFLGGGNKVGGFDYHGCDLIDVHKAHREHVKSFLLYAGKPGMEASLRVAYCAFHGAGRKAVPRLLEETGFKHVTSITRNELNELNGLFPSFCSDAGKEQQPDPGDPRAAERAVSAFKEEYPGEWEETDILIGTDPDADRCAVVVKVPEAQRPLYGGKDYTLLTADDLWALVLWFRLNQDKAADREKAFVVLSHTTSDSIVRLSLKNGLGVVKTWVGFAALSAGVRDTWDGKLATGLSEGRKSPSDPLCHPFIQETVGMDAKRVHNAAAMEQSNGFSILGSPPPDQFSLGTGGHVRDKDGTFAAMLIAEVAEWARQQGTTVFELIDKHVYLDPDIGLFVNHYEPDPLDGEYPGIKGDRIKKTILETTLDLHRRAKEGGLEIGGLAVKSTCIYRTGKYDAIYPPSGDFEFPDEGVRFYFDEDRLNHLTIRPSGTTNSLRFHTQLHSPVSEDNLLEKKRELHRTARGIEDSIRELVGAPR
jgi:phosphomannomutase